MTEDMIADKSSYVDLGLSVKWATCNLGANAPEEFGDYYAWGETRPKETFTDENYKYETGMFYSKLLVSGKCVYSAILSDFMH